jgi:hypothetical protein
MAREAPALPYRKFALGPGQPLPKINPRCPCPHETLALPAPDVHLVNSSYQLGHPENSGCPERSCYLEIDNRDNPIDNPESPFPMTDDRSQVFSSTAQRLARGCLFLALSSLILAWPIMSSALAGTQNPRSPDGHDSPLPFLWWRLTATVLGGLLWQVGRLARRFRHYLGLGVFTNFWALGFLIVGSLLPGASALLELGISRKVAEPAGDSTNWLAALIANGTGLTILGILPHLGQRRPRPAADTYDARNSARFVAKDPILGSLEDQTDRVSKMNLQEWLSKDASEYPWNVIKVAGKRIIENERPVDSVPNAALKKHFDSVSKQLDDAGKESDAARDRDEKYRVLSALFRLTGYQSLKHSLQLAKAEN